MTNTSRPHIESFTLHNEGGLKMDVINFGCKIVSLWVPDKNGNADDIVLGYDSVDQYPTGNPYFGAVIGRYGNRIANGKFSLNGKEYQLHRNNGVNALHGGPTGFHNVYWLANPIDKNKIAFEYTSRDGEESYPGTLHVKMVYTLTDQNELQIEYEAVTDEETIVNLTHHSFFNLAGAGKESIHDHELQINAHFFCAVNSSLIPTGELRPVKNTPFDFTSLHKIGNDIDSNDEQLIFGKGYDHNWVLNKKPHELSQAAKVVEKKSGRVMDVWTTEPGLQFYSGNFLTGSDVGKNQVAYQHRSAFCVEAQHFPDSPNHAHFPTTVLKPGETYRQKTVYGFSVLK